MDGTNELMGSLEMIVGTAKPLPPIWWFLKVLGGLALLLSFLWVSLRPGDQNTLWPVPVWIAQILVIGGVTLGLSQYLTLKRFNRGLAVPQQLVTDRGLFRWVRHPMYLGDLVVLTGLCLLVNRWWALPIWGGSLCCVLLLCRHEDHYLLNLFPEQYTTYMRHSARVIPLIW